MLDNFPKKSRYAIGEKIDTAFLDAIESLFTASFQPRNTKLPYLQKATSKMDLVKFFLCIAWEMKDIDNKKYIALSALLEEVGRMLGSWMRNVQVPQDEKTSATPRA